MQRIVSELSTDVYAFEMRQRLRLLPRWFHGGLSGVMIGRFFSVAHRAEYNINRKITSECHRAIGYLSAQNGRTCVKYVHTAGLFSMFWLILFSAFFAVMFMQDESYLVRFLLPVSMSIFICGITAIADSVTQNGIESMDELYRFLRNPQEYYG